MSIPNFRNVVCLIVAGALGVIIGWKVVQTIQLLVNFARGW